MDNIKAKLSEFMNVDAWLKSIAEHAPRISAETMGWVAVVFLHLATIPTLIAVLTGLTDKMPPVDMVLFLWAGLLFFFLKATIQKDLLNIITIGLGFFVQAGLLALIVFK
jgi:hypothetical protein